MSKIHVVNVDDGKILSEHNTVSEVIEGFESGSIPGIKFNATYNIYKLEKTIRTVIETVDLTEEVFNKTPVKTRKSGSKSAEEASKAEVPEVPPDIPSKATEVIKEDSIESPTQNSGETIGQTTDAPIDSNDQVLFEEPVYSENTFVDLGD